MGGKSIAVLVEFALLAKDDSDVKLEAVTPTF